MSSFLADSTTRSPIPREEKSSLLTTLAGVSAITATFVYFLIFAQFGFLDLARDGTSRNALQVLMGILGIGGLAGSVFSARLFVPERGNRFLMAGFGGCLLAALLTFVGREGVLLFFCAALVGFSTGWTTVALSLCLRPTLHHARLGAWCGLGTGFAYAICNQVLIFEATASAKIVVAAVAAGFGLLVSRRVRGAPARISATPDYGLRAAVGWIIVLMVLVFLDTLAFYIIQNISAAKQNSWETPLILQGYAFVHICVAFITGLVIDQRWTSVSVLIALLLMVLSCFLLGFGADKLPQARMLHIAAISIYSTVLIYLPARGGSPKFAAALFAISGWLGSGIAFALAIGFEARRVGWGILFIALALGAAALFTRLLWIKRVQATRGART